MLDDSVSASTLQFGLLDCLIVKVTLWNVAIIAGNVCSNLSSAYGQLVKLIRHLSRLVWQFVSWVCAQFAKALMVFRIKESAVTDVSLAGKTP